MIETADEQARAWELSFAFNYQPAPYNTRSIILCQAIGVKKTVSRMSRRARDELRLFHYCEAKFLGYNLFMNKRAKKRVKEEIEKKNLERAKAIQEQNLSSSKKQPESRGFTVRPDKKRG